MDKMLVQHVWDGPGIPLVPHLGHQVKHSPISHQQLHDILSAILGGAVQCCEADLQNPWCGTPSASI